LGIAGLRLQTERPLAMADGRATVKTGAAVMHSRVLVDIRRALAGGRA